MFPYLPISHIRATWQPRVWLDKNGFEGCFVGWNAVCLLGADRNYIRKEIPNSFKAERVRDSVNSAMKEYYGEGISKYTVKIIVIL